MNKNQLTLQFPTPEPVQSNHAVQLRTVGAQKPVTWQMSESEASFFIQMLEESSPFTTHRSLLTTNRERIAL